MLKAIWQHERLLRDQFRTLDGKIVRVLHPGFFNHESGPDFRNAIVKIGDEPPRAGDVEVDLHASGWRTHHHEGNPAFQNVLLHVIWDSTHPAAAKIPTLPLRQSLDAPISELSLWLGSEGGPPLPENLLDQCSAPLRSLVEPRLTELLHQAAQVRWQGKAAQFQARARQVGWEQSLWEGVFHALGYKHNILILQNPFHEVRLSTSSSWKSQGDC